MQHKFMQPDVAEVCRLVQNANVVRKEHIKKLLANSGRPPEAVDSVIYNAKKSRRIITDKQNLFLLSGENISYSALTVGKNKALWLYVNLADKFQYYDFKARYPSELLLIKGNEKNNVIEDYNVFYVPKGKENLTKTIIMSAFGVKNQEVEEYEKIRCIVIFDTEDQRLDFSLPPNYEVAFYATINNANGEAKFFK